jgi:hypothetical protein
MWPKGKELVKVMAKFKNFCGIPSFHKTIDITQIHVQKPQTVDYFSFKSRGYNMQLQIVVDYHNKIQDIFVKMPNSMNDA